MEEAFAFMEEMRIYPIQECGESLVSLTDAVDGRDVQFSTTLINNSLLRVFFIREGLIKSFLHVVREIKNRGWILKVEDGYRSPEMQRAQSHNPKHFDIILQKAIWELGGEIPDAAFMLRRMSAMIATRCRIGTHVSGSAIDISVLSQDTGQEVDRGGSYIEFSERTPMASPFVTPAQRQNRDEITAIFNRFGWQHYPWEFWHYSNGDSYAEYLGNSGQPARYGPVVFQESGILPIGEAESDVLLEPVEFYRKEISLALGRLEKPSE